MGVENIGITAKAKLLTYREECGGYIVYVFELLEGAEPYDKYIMCTRFPRWQSPPVEIGEEGYLRYREVLGGKDSWYDYYNDQNVKYRYTGIHFLDFIPIKPKKELII